MTEIDAYNYGKGLGYKSNCEDSYDANDTSSLSDNYKTTNMTRDNKSNLLNVINDSCSDMNENSFENDSYDSSTSTQKKLKKKPSNSSFTYLVNWFSKHNDQSQQNVTKKKGTRESIRQLFSQQKTNSEVPLDDNDVVSYDERYNTVYKTKTNSRPNSINSIHDIDLSKDFFNKRLSDDQISKTKFGKRLEYNSTVQPCKSILKPADFKANSNDRPKSVSFYEENELISYDNIESDLSNSIKDESNNILSNNEPLSGETLSSPVKTEQPKVNEEYLDTKIDLSKAYGFKEPDDNKVVVKTHLELDKKTIKFLQTLSGSRLEEELLRNPKRLLEIYVSYIANLKAQRFKVDKELQKDKVEREKLQFLLKESKERISQLELNVTQLSKDKDDNKKKFGGLYKKIRTIKKESKNNKNMKRYYNDFVTAYCGIVTTLATESTTFEKLQSKNKGYVNDNFFKNQKNLKVKLLELSYRSLNHTVFNSKNTVDKIRKENSDMFKEIETMLLQNLEYI
ncbi:unnamed protein product [Hanseniaspora opuntiae]